MHIALLANEHPLFPTKGSSVVFTDLTHALLEAGHEVTFFLLEWNMNAKYTPADLERELAALGPDQRARLHVHKFDYRAPAWMRWRPGGLWLRWKLRQFILARYRERPFDLLESGDGYGLLPFGLGRRFPVVIRLHGNTLLFDTILEKPDPDTFIHGLERRTLLHADRLVAVSRYSLEKTFETNALPARLRPRSTYIYNCVDSRRYTPRPNARVEPGLILYINSIENRKGTRELIAAMPEVVAAHPEARLVIIGSISGRAGFTDADRAKLLEDLPEPVRAHVQLLGWVSQAEKEDWLNKAHISCYPSKFETFGIAPVEAMMMGRPVIYSKYGAAPEVIEHGVSGLHSDPYVPGDIAKQINTLLGDPALAARLAQAGQDRARRLFDRAGWARQNLDYYASCLKQAPQS